jgi:hypothetical protein
MEKEKIVITKVDWIGLILSLGIFFWGSFAIGILHAHILAYIFGLFVGGTTMFMLGWLNVFKEYEVEANEVK